MGLKDYTEEQLKAELKRRIELRKAKKAEEMKTAKRCRNCKHCVVNHRWTRQHLCMARTCGKDHPRHYTVPLSKPACELFERKEDVEPND